MIDHTILPPMLVPLILAIVATGITLGILIEQSARALWSKLPDMINYVTDHAKSPDAGDRLVGMTIVICGVMFLISDYANDWYGAAL